MGSNQSKSTYGTFPCAKVPPALTTWKCTLMLMAAAEKPEGVTWFAVKCASAAFTCSSDMEVPQPLWL